MMHIGFTGTRHGMTQAQLSVLERYLSVEFCSGDAEWLHHGDCIGADYQCHHIARQLGYKIAGHPALFGATRAFCDFDAEIPPAAYLVRNREIVDACETLLATPADMTEQLRSGTWATVRYAKLRGKPVLLILPNGNREFC
jgi:hypothetical protein